MIPGITLYWFRQDLRLHDNPAFSHAAASSEWLLPVYIHDARQEQLCAWGFQRMGNHRRAFLRGALNGLRKALCTRQSMLFEYHGDTPKVLIECCARFNITRIVCEEIAAPEEQDDIISLQRAGIRVESVWQSTMLSVTTLPFQPVEVPDVFTAFRQRIEKAGIRFDACAPDVERLPRLPAIVMGHTDDADAVSSCSDSLASSLAGDAGCIHHAPLGSSATDQPSGSFPYASAGFSGSEQDALAYLESYFQSDRPARYRSTRNGLSGVEFSTKFSPWLALGSLSPRRIMQRLTAYESLHGQNDGSYWIWFELLWRDHFRWLHHKYGRRLYRKGGLISSPKQDAQQTSFHPHELERWISGNTGHPFVDAGMRELRTTGFLSNRMRQVVASYLIHDLHVDWRAGAAWFESQLIDYDVYSNQGNWAYLAGVGTDPRGGRRFNPDKQAAEHDPNGTYQTQWGT